MVLLVLVGNSSPFLGTNENELRAFRTCVDGAPCCLQLQETASDPGEIFKSGPHVPSEHHEIELPDGGMPSPMVAAMATMSGAAHETGESDAVAMESGESSEALTDSAAANEFTGTAGDESKVAEVAHIDTTREMVEETEGHQNETGLVADGSAVAGKPMGSAAPEHTSADGNLPLAVSTEEGDLTTETDVGIVIAKNILDTLVIDNP